jgi:hypothetical protein
MALKFTGRRFHDDQTGTVTFPAWNGPARVNCRITDEALMFMFGAVRTDTGLVDAFDKNKASIEVAAAWKFEALAGATTITLASRDFPDKKPAAAADPEAAAARAAAPPPDRAPAEGDREPQRVSAQKAAEKVEQFRRQTRDLATARSVDADIAAWNAETAKVLGKLDADTLAAEAAEEEAADGAKPGS